MGCISGKAHRIGGIISAGSSRIGGIISARASRIGGITASASLICEINQGAYIRVIPTETQWVNVDISTTYNIETNREWLLE